MLFRSGACVRPLSRCTAPSRRGTALTPARRVGYRARRGGGRRVMLALRADRAMSCAAVADARAGSFPVRGTPQVTPPTPRLLDRVREAIRARHDRRRTEKTDVAWIRRDLLGHGPRHPAEMGAAEVTRFLTSLARRRSRGGLDAEPGAERPAVSLSGGGARPTGGSTSDGGTRKARGEAGSDRSPRSRQRGGAGGEVIGEPAPCKASRQGSGRRATVSRAPARCVLPVGEFHRH